MCTQMQQERCDGKQGCGSERGLRVQRERERDRVHFIWALIRELKAVNYMSVFV